MTSDKSLYSVLALAGTLPFLACALLPLVGISQLEPVGRLDQVANSYGLAIVCFLTGIHWAIALLEPQRTPFDLLIGSNVVFLTTWFVFVLADLPWSLITQSMSLVVLLLIDWQLLRSAVIDRTYFQFRFVATAIGSMALGLITLT